MKWLPQKGFVWIFEFEYFQFGWKFKFTVFLGSSIWESTTQRSLKCLRLTIYCASALCSQRISFMRRSSGNIPIVLYSRAVSCHRKTRGFRFSSKASVSENWNPKKHHHPSIPKKCLCHRDLFRLMSHHHHPQQQTEQARAWYYC